MKRLCLLSLCLILVASSAFAVNKNDPVDLEGLPDLVVSDYLDKQWVVRVENLPANYCSVIEGGVEPGWRKLLRFTVMTPNLGDADLYVGDPNDPANADLFELAECHGHHHFKHYATYELIDATGYVWRASKNGFCMLDTDPVPVANGSQPPKSPRFLNCGAIGHTGNQGISAGWADTYRFFLGGQYFVLDGGDGQAPVPAGDYRIRITVNPPYSPDSNGDCPRAKDGATGLCHQFAESNYGNNVTEARVSIPEHPGREGVGPLRKEPPLTYEPTDK